MKVQIPAQLMNKAIFLAKESNGEVFPFKGMPGELPQHSAEAWGPAELIGFEFLPIYMQGYRGGIPAGCDLVAVTPSGEMYELMGFDEVGMFGEALYGFTPSYGNGDLSKFEFTQDKYIYQEALDSVAL